MAETKISDDVLSQFKERMHITHKSEDSNLERLLSFSVAAIKTRCGEFDIDKNESAKELVFERARYAYNDAVEFFDDNFLSDMNTLAFDLLPDDEEAEGNEEV